MENTKLLKLLRVLTPAELQGLKKYIHTPFFNQRKEVPALLEVLLPALKNNKPAPDKASVYQTIFGKGDHNDHRVRLAMSFLYQITVQFLAVQDFLSDTPQFQRHAATSLRKRHLPDQFASAHQEANIALQQRPERNADFLEEQYRLQLEQYRFDHAHQPTIIPTQMQELSNTLDYAFIARKLWQACFLHSHQAMSSAAYDQGLLHAILLRAKEPDTLAIPAISVYYHCYKAMTVLEDDYFFQQFKAQVLAPDNVFPTDEMRDLFVLGVNFCIRQYNAGNTNYLAEQFDFYRVGLEKQYFLSDGGITRYTYLNVVTCALAVQAFDWAEQFIHHYQAYLAESHREALYSFNLARFEYRRHQFGPALRLLQKADYKDVQLHLAAKMLQLKIYYESGEYDLLESHLQAMRAFLNRKKDMGYNRENYRNTVHFVQKLLETNLLDKTQRQGLRREIEDTKAVAEKEWLLGQVR